jgi:crossover junction endodeoxyribonuclease RuvC
MSKMVTEKSIVGVDPGLSGALALIGPRVLVERMPVRMNGNKRVVDAAEVCRLLNAWGPTHAVIENVWASPQMGVVSAFSFGHSKGVVEAAVAAGVPVENVYMVAPAVWKGRMGVTADKQTSIKLAMKLFPALGKLTADEAEAVLLAVYGLMFAAQPKGP